ncbi:synaptosome-associated proteinsynaptosomal-associated protein 25 [Fomitiporia mediterranea MF3/22]|uniref:synaptosome-associated proteinsynaptosomal-associated protein 25 n=1 Tax=Fomitiporia mediterranea (strain MF3/22) TaxID=694068 RepID=UPI0004407A01|nr:synaptosome-associated proteinsynaptosomal-associated protein 25 [Fomitiporia mediterranea MF3/22]EJD03920.1 synaptosome-associated proteinsynaptosomal-associated protein 25 [Fomitiporia mediterranea MF3/22]
MSWFKKDKNKSLIPPVDAAPPARAPSSASSSAPPSYRSTTNTYIASRDGDLSDPRAHGKSYGQYSYKNRNEYGVQGGVSDPYARGERDIDTDRNALFAGSAPPSEGRTNNFYDGPPSNRPAPQPGQETEEDVDEVINKTRWLKQDTVQTTRNALRVAREAEETGRATLLQLGDQSEKIADTERHIDVGKGAVIRAEDNADEIKKLNRSIFIPAITFNKDAKRLAQERKRQMRYDEEMTEREQAMTDLRDSQNRVGRGATFGRSISDDGEGIGGSRRQLTSAQQALRKEERKRYQFEATESDDEMEDEIDNNLDEILDATKRMKALGLSMGSELQAQNQRLVRIADKADRLGNKVDLNTSKLNRIAR